MTFDRRDFLKTAAAGLSVHPWTINEPAEIQRFLSSGVASITTDDPETALLLRNGMDTATH